MEPTQEHEKTIREFLADWWNDMTFQAQNTVAGAQLPVLTDQQLYDQLFGLTLRDIAVAAEGQMPDDRRGEILDAVQTFVEWMWARPGMGSNYSVPSEFWATPIGYMALQAHLWAAGDELISIAQASEETGRSISALSQLVDRGRLTGYRDPSEPNPTRATRLSRQQLAQLKTTSRRKNDETAL